MMEIAIAILGSGVLSTIISLLVGVWQNQKKQEHGVNAGVQILLYDRIKYLCKHHLDRGFVAVEDLEDLERMHKIYHDELHGNGFLDSLMTKVRALPNERIEL